MEPTLQYTGKLITFEGLDGCGKSTQLALAAEYLRSRGQELVSTSEPGGTALGMQVRAMVLQANPGELSPLTETALMFAARAQHIEQVILPALRRGAIVLCDRFTDSTFAYQGYGHDVPLQTIAALEELLCQGVRPDRTVLLDIDAPTSSRRTITRNADEQQTASRFEQEGGEYFSRVRAGYLEMARREPGRFDVVDAGGSTAEVQNRVRDSLARLLQQTERGASSGV